MIAFPKFSGYSCAASSWKIGTAFFANKIFSICFFGRNPCGTCSKTRSTTRLRLSSVIRFGGNPASATRSWIKRLAHTPLSDNPPSRDLPFLGSGNNEGGSGACGPTCGVVPSPGSGVVPSLGSGVVPSPGSGVVPSPGGVAPAINAANSSSAAARSSPFRLSKATVVSSCSTAWTSVSAIKAM